jgi:hypothetical protein
MKAKKNLKLNNFLIQEFDKNPTQFCHFFETFQKENPHQSFYDLDLLFLHAFSKKKISYLYELPFEMHSKSFFPYGVFHDCLGQNISYFKDSILILQELLQHHILKKQHIIYSLEKTPQEIAYSLWFLRNQESFLPILQSFYLNQKPQNPIKFLFKNISPLLNAHDVFQNLSYQEKIKKNILYIYEQIKILNPHQIKKIEEIQHPLLLKILLEQKLIIQPTIFKQKV